MNQVVFWRRLYLLFHLHHRRNNPWVQPWQESHQFSVGLRVLLRFLPFVFLIWQPLSRRLLRQISEDPDPGLYKLLSLLFPQQFHHILLQAVPLPTVQSGGQEVRQGELPRLDLNPWHFFRNKAHWPHLFRKQYPRKEFGLSKVQEFDLWSKLFQRSKYEQITL